MDEKEAEKIVKKKVNEVSANKSYDTRIDYYLNKGYNEDESIEKLKKRQQTFTLEKCIQKYGQEDGYKIYSDRQNKWQKSLLLNGNLKCGYSNISQELFYQILEYYNQEDKKHFPFP